jgi:hypothetical protein
VELGFDGEPQRGGSQQADHILIAPRGMSQEDLVWMQGQVANSGLKHKLPDTEVLFKSKEMLIDAERQAA